MEEGEAGGGAVREGSSLELLSYTSSLCTEDMEGEAGGGVGLLFGSFVIL